MLAGKAALVVACAVSLCAPGCAAQQRRVAGQTLTAVGGLTTLGGLSVATGCLGWSDERDPWQPTPAQDMSTSCAANGFEPHPEVGLPVLTVGLSVLVLAGVVYATSLDPPRKSAPRPPAPEHDLPLF